MPSLRHTQYDIAKEKPSQAGLSCVLQIRFGSREPSRQLSYFASFAI